MSISVNVNEQEVRMGISRKATFNPQVRSRSHQEMEMKGGLRRMSKEVSILRDFWFGMRLKDDFRLRMRCIGRGTGDGWRGGDFPGKIRGR